MGAVSLRAGDLPEAVRLLQDALDAFARGHLEFGRPTTLVLLSRALRMNGALDRAQALAEEAERLATTAGELGIAVLARVELARQARAANDLEAAFRHTAQAVRLADDGGLRAEAIVSRVERASIQLAMDRVDEALADYRAAIRLIDGIRGRIISPDLRATYADASHGAYEGLVDTLLAAHERSPSAGFAQQALVVIEEERAQNLVDALNGAFADRSREVPEPMRARRRLLDQRAAAAQLALQNNQVSAPERARLSQDLDDAERDLVMLAASDSARGTSTPLSVVPHEAAELQRSLPADEAVLLYVVRPEHGWVYVITRDAMALIVLSPPPELNDRIGVFSALLAGGRGRDALPAGRALSRALVSPVTPHLPSSVSRLIISATGALAGLPFAALPIGDGATEEPLLARYEIAMNPSMTALMRIRQRDSHRGHGSVLAYGSPAGQRTGTPLAERLARLEAIPASVEEARRAAGTVASSTLRIGADATEASLREPSGTDYRVIHFASHALLDAAVPERSAILLAPSPGSDGLLQPREVFGLDVAADVVVLAACETAAGRSSQAEGLQSLSRAFLYAGARSVVGTLWPVGDRAAADVMQQFYRELRGGSAAGAALRRAQLRIAGRDPYATAGRWAGYVITGDPLADPQLRANRRMPPVWIWLLATGVLLGLAAVLVMRPETIKREGPHRPPL